MLIHKFTEVSSNARIAADVIIGPFTTIEADVEIGEGSWIGPNVTIMNGARIGKNCKVFPGAVISAVPQDLKYEGEETLTIIGDNTVIRECVTLNKGTKQRGKTVIGNDCLIMSYVHVAHDCFLGDRVILVSYSGVAGVSIIDDWAVVGGKTAIHQFSKIGKHAMVAGASRVRKDVPPYAKAGRDPLAYVGVNSIGLRRRGFTNEKINEIQDIYRIIYQSGYNHSEALDFLEANFLQTPERDEIVNFIRTSKRGIMKGYTGTDEEEIEL